MRSPDLEVNVLVAMQDVTARVQGAAKGIADNGKALKAREAEVAAITKESKDKTGLRSDVVTFYNGGEYWLYQYKAYTDVRLVFAPEAQAAFFGGDPDNFTYPRYDLDMAIFRVYENGKPLHTDNYLKLNAKGAAPGELESAGDCARSRVPPKTAAVASKPLRRNRLRLTGTSNPSRSCFSGAMSFHELHRPAFSQQYCQAL